MITEHCLICDNSKVDFKLGVMCNLTGKKPDFSQKCGVIKLINEFESKIKEVNIEYEAVKKTKTDVYGLLVFYGLITIAFFIGGYLIGKYALESAVISTAPLIIMAVGLVPLGMAIGPFNHYRTHLDIAKKKKNNLDTIAKMYGYNYDIDIEHLKDSLGNLSYNVDLKIKKTHNTIS